jgi:hypothetical protein
MITSFRISSQLLCYAQLHIRGHPALCKVWCMRACLPGGMLEGLSPPASGNSCPDWEVPF